jgi:uncharacterized RDD family membrane protein YckC
MAAVIIDGLVVVLPVFAIAYLFSLAFPHHGFFFERSGVSTTTSLTGVTKSQYTFLLPLSGWLLISALSLSYFFVCEALWGKTVGKRAMGLRVRSVKGEAAGRYGIAVRTVLRLIDGIAFYLVGWLVALLSGGRRRRIGDWLGGTMVVRDDGVPEYLQDLEVWRVALFPAGCLLISLVAVFGFGLDTAISEPEQAVALVRSYVKAREEGNAGFACSLLTAGEQREVVAIESGSYASAQASRCPEYILRDQSDSHLLNPGLVRLSETQLNGVPTPLGGVVVYSPQDPGLRLIAVPEDGHMRLDMRGLEKLEFVRACAAVGEISSAECSCTFDLARAQNVISETGLTQSDLRALAADRARCQGTGAIQS